MTLRLRSGLLSVTLLAACAFSLLAGVHLHAEYISFDIENVPVDRLVKNLEQLLTRDPDDVQSRFNLARVHAMAFAKKTNTAQIVRGAEWLGPWFGHEPANVPFLLLPTAEPAFLEAAQAHLAKAIERYQEVIRLDPTHLVAKLGYAWCVEQTGDKEQAIRAYRQVIREAWSRERDLATAGTGWHSVTAEAAGYLIRLLDSDTDRDEIATLRERTAEMAKVIRAITPIAIPLRRGSSAAELLNASARVSFDADGSGLKKSWTWITADAGWLVYAPGGHGQVSSALQMFGSVAFWLFWDNGYQAMRALDDDGDGRLRGAELAGLAIWHDRNENGLAEAGEVKSLADWGIVSLSCTYQVDETSRDAVAFSPAGVTFADGDTRPTYDLVLDPRPVCPGVGTVSPQDPSPARCS